MNVVYFRSCLVLLFMVFASAVDAIQVPLTLSMTAVSELETLAPRRTRWCCGP